MTTSPMLAASLPCIKKAKKLGRSPTEAEVLADLRKLELEKGFLVSPKVDGIRGFVKGGVVLSRTWKPIPNVHVQRMFGKDEFEGLDGELTLQHWKDFRTYNDNQSAIMTEQGPEDIWFNVFDQYSTSTASARFFHRTQRAMEIVDRVDPNTLPQICYLSHSTVNSIEQLLKAEEEAVIMGAEGLMGRHPLRPYKLGRSTFIEQGLFKLKRFEDSEAEIIGFIELQRNNNEATIDARGFQVRSSHKSGKVAADTLGLFQVRDVATGIEFECGSGLDDATRDAVWADRPYYMGRWIKYKSQPHGVKEKPRSPIFLGFRHAEDM